LTVSPQKQRTTFAKQQRERARMEKAAEKRKRREDRKLGLEEGGEGVEGDSDEATEAPLDPNDPYYLAKYFERQQAE
jgi:hypothetical protein